MIIANWKANGDFESNKVWCDRFITRMSEESTKSIGITPSHLHFNQIKNHFKDFDIEIGFQDIDIEGGARTCLLYTSPSPRDLSTSRMPSSA